MGYVLRDCAGDGLSALSDNVVKATNALVAWVNLSEPPSNPEAGKIYGRGFRWPRLKSFDPVQAAELVFAQEVIRMVCVKETVDKRLGGRVRYVRPRRGNLQRDWRRAD